MRGFRKNKKGFTLVELIVVVAVLAVLATIAVPIVGNVVGRANSSTDASNIALYQSAIETYVATATSATPSGGGGTYPVDAATAVTAISRFSSTATNAGGTLLNVAPNVGAATACFVYDISATATAHKVSIAIPTATLVAISIAK
jgi:prepilin-type N-terminal cleavage/methylation domain-containing protein